MLAWELVVEAEALRSQGWTGQRDRPPPGRIPVDGAPLFVRGTDPGVRARSAPDRFSEFAEYCRLRLGADPHLWATTLFDEVVALGYSGSYASFTRAIRQRELRPACSACRQAKTVDRAVIEHPPGAETQWDWVELPDPPAGWGWGKSAYVLIGALPASARWRGWLAESTDQPHLAEGLDAVARRLGGLTRGGVLIGCRRWLSPRVGGCRCRSGRSRTFPRIGGEAPARGERHTDIIDVRSYPLARDGGLSDGGLYQPVELTSQRRRIQMTSPTSIAAPTAAAAIATRRSRVVVMIWSRVSTAFCRARSLTSSLSERAVTVCPSSSRVCSISACRSLIPASRPGSG